MATLLIQHGETGPDGTPPPRAYFQLIEGKLHIPTIRDYFRLSNIALDGIVYPTDPEGFTFSSFTQDTTLQVTGNPLTGNSRTTRILLIRTSEVYGDPDQPGGKRKVVQTEENLGLWTLPPPGEQPRTLTELAAALRAFLQIEHSITWLFKYRYFTEVVPIVSDSALSEAFDHFRAMSAQCADDDSAVSQHCRLYLNTISEEVAPRDLIRARISGILDAAAATSSGRDAAAAAAAAAASVLPQHLPPAQLSPQPAALQPPPPPQQSTLQLPPAADNAAAAMALLGNHLAAAGFGPYLALQQAGEAVQQDAYGSAMATGGSGGDADGDDADDGEHGDGGTLTGLLYQRQSGSEGTGGGPNQAGLKKESKTRHADGRFKNESQHQRKMADMSRKIAELFEGTITNLVEVCDHKKIMCLVCNHACTAYSAYHTDCVRKHFLRHHESTLRERGVDVGRWRKDYEVSQKVKRQQQMQQEQVQPVVIPTMASSLGPQGITISLGPNGHITLPPNVLINGLNGLNGFPAISALSGLGAIGVSPSAGTSEGETSAPRGLQAQLLSIAGFPVDLSLGLGSMLAQQLPPGAAGGANPGAGGGGAGAAAGSVTALLQQAHDEHSQLAAGTGPLSSLITAASTTSVNAGQGQTGSAAPSLATQMSGALGGSGSGGGAAVALAPMARMASGTVTTEMPLPPPPLPPAQVVSGGGADPLLHEVGGLTMTRSASVASQGPGSLPNIRSPPVVTTDMSQPSA